MSTQFDRDECINKESDLIQEIREMIQEKPNIRSIFNQYLNEKGEAVVNRLKSLLVDFSRGLSEEQIKKIEQLIELIEKRLEKN